MRKFFKKMKKWVSGITAVLLLVSILPVQSAAANVVQLSVNSLSTPNNSPIVSGTSKQQGEIIVSVPGQPGVPAALVLGSDGVYNWTAQLGSVTPIVPGEYVVTADLDVNSDSNPDYTASNSLNVLPLTISTMDLQFVKDFDPAQQLTGNFEDGYVLEVDGNPATNYIITSSEIKTNEPILATAPGPGYELMMSSPNHPPSHFGFLKSDGTWDGLTTKAGASIFGPVWNGDQEEGLYTVKTVIKDSDRLNVDFEFKLTFNNPATPSLSLTQDVTPSLITDDTQDPEVVINTDVPGLVTYEGGCSGDKTQVIAGDNTIKLSANYDDKYSECKIVVEDRAGDIAKIEVSEFVVDKTGPTVSAGPDILANNKTIINASTENAGTGISKYEWTQVSGPGVVTFSSTTIEDPFVSADFEGVYELQLMVTDNTGLVRTAKDTMKLTWDANVSDVRNLTIEIDNGIADLSWELSGDPDVDRIVIYRSKLKNELGDVLIMLTPHTISYEDTGLLEDTIYYYTVVQVDDAGNESDGVVVSGKWVEKYVSSAPIVTSEEPEEDQEIKSGVTNNSSVKEDGNEKENNTNVPTFGIVVLILLIVLGVYLLYLQNPEIFRKMAFWQKRR